MRMDGKVNNPFDRLVDAAEALVRKHEDRSIKDLLDRLKEQQEEFEELSIRRTEEAAVDHFRAFIREAKALDAHAISIVASGGKAGNLSGAEVEHAALMFLIDPKG